MFDRKKILSKLKNAGRDTSLRANMIRMLVILLTSFVLVFLITTYVLKRKAGEDFTRNTSETAVNNVASTINAVVENYNYISRLIMVNESVVGFLHASEADRNMSYDARMGMYEILNMYSTISYIESVYVFRFDGQFANTGKGEYIINTASDEWKQILERRGARRLSIDGNGMMCKTDGKTSLTFSRAIYDINSQELLGILVMNISNRCFDEVLSLQTASEMCVLDEKGNLLCGSEEIAGMYQPEYAGDEMSHRAIRYHGRRSTFAGKRAVDPLVVLCCTSASGGTLPVQISFALMLTLVFFLVATVSCAWFVRSNITQPILTLHEAMEKTKSSGWMERIEEEMPDNEIGRLAESYNSMIDSLNKLFDQLLKEEEAIRKAEMRVLHEQIKPHFLYNTLGTISYLALEEKAVRAQEALETLGSFYRNFLSKGERDIPFERELRITRDYLSLQKLRYGDSFTDEYEIDEKACTCMVPKLILQPLVENCIYHGVRLKGEKCVIRISAEKNEYGLHVRIFDTGVGMSAQQIEDVLYDGEEKPEGFGLCGTINRIRYYCNDRNAVTIHSEEGEYTEIELFIPEKVKRDSEKGESEIV